MARKPVVRESQTKDFESPVDGESIPERPKRRLTAISRPLLSKEKLRNSEGKLRPCEDTFSWAINTQ